MDTTTSSFDKLVMQLAKLTDSNVPHKLDKVSVVEFNEIIGGRNL